MTKKLGVAAPSFFFTIFARWFSVNPEKLEKLPLLWYIIKAVIFYSIVFIDEMTSEWGFAIIGRRLSWKF